MPHHSDTSFDQGLKPSRGPIAGPTQKSLRRISRLLFLDQRALGRATPGLATARHATTQRKPPKLKTGIWLLTNQIHITPKFLQWLLVNQIDKPSHECQALVGRPKMSPITPFIKQGKVSWHDSRLYKNIYIQNFVNMHELHQSSISCWHWVAFQGVVVGL